MQKKIYVIAGIAAVAIIIAAVLFAGGLNISGSATYELKKAQTGDVVSIKYNYRVNDVLAESADAAEPFKFTVGSDTRIGRFKLDELVPGMAVGEMKDLAAVDSMPGKADRIFIEILSIS